MVFIILSSRLFMLSSLSLNLLVVPSSVFFIAIIVFSSDCFSFIFSRSLLKFSLCSAIRYPSPVSILITIALNSLSVKFLSLLH